MFNDTSVIIENMFKIELNFFSGVKLLDGLVNDRIEGTALGYAYKLVDIYSASWGPNDDGKTVDGPGTLAREALERGIREVRKQLTVNY